ncbi:hypothetical protein [Glutamicibacter halophytocola]|uniref:Uncharacterized protein n=1 Tax=Glutamicibacter halophytocola TaxID=1933880 RepID=A0AA94XY79_9MICC|nr:hypothetical protein [Glutamicibacter halophytocola]UUX60136.1 hypothetical protein NUH22_05870 [Glutamicibacter halophytocola]
MSAPTRGGQAVRRIATGEIGITTDEPMKRSPRIGVQYIGRPYTVTSYLEDLEVIELIESTETKEPPAVAAAEGEETKHSNGK